MCDVTVADTSKNWFKYLKSHSFNFKNYDYVLEIHFNSGGGTGTEIFVTTSEKGIGVETAIVQQMCAAVGYRNRGVKRYNWSVISKAKAQGVSSALLEVAFIDNASDMLTYTAYKDNIVTAIAAGIAEGYSPELIAGYDDEGTASITENRSAHRRICTVTSRRIQ